VDIGASANLEVVDKFWYLGDMLSVDGDADAAVEARIRIGWNKFRYKWVHKKRSGVKGSMYKVMRSFICRGCSNPVISTGHTSVDIGASAILEAVDTFWCLGDMLSVDGDANAAVEARIRIGWNKFRQLVPLLTNRDISLIRRGRLYSSCVRSSMLHGSETWPVRKENEVALQ